MALAWTIVAWLALQTLVLWRVARAPRPSPCPPWRAPYALVRVCGGPEPHLFDNLLSAAQICGQLPSAVIFVFPANDPLRSVIEAAQAALVAKGLHATLWPTRAWGANHKVAQLAEATPLLPEDVVVYADGDVDLTDYPLAALCAPLHDADIAAVWAPCAERARSASAAVLDASLHCFALLGRLDAGGMVGKLWAVRSAALAQAGGWVSLVDVLGEDMELARRLRDQGKRIVMVPTAASSRPCARPWRDAVARYARWFWVIRAQRPWLLPTYPLLFFGTLYVLPLCLCVKPPAWAAGLACCVLALRWGLGLAARHALGLSSDGLARAIVLADITMLAAFTRMLCARHVQWRHQVLRVDRDGRIACRGAEPP